MPIGSTASIYQSGTFFQRDGLSRSSTSGSTYQRFETSNAQKMNRQAIQKQISAYSGGVSSIFNTTVTLWEGLSKLAAQQAKTGIQAQLEAKVAEANAATGKLLNLKA